MALGRKFQVRAINKVLFTHRRRFPVGGRKELPPYERDERCFERLVMSCDQSTSST
jgi:hypothetical protein